MCVCVLSVRQTTRALRWSSSFNNNSNNTGIPPHSALSVRCSELGAAARQSKQLAEQLSLVQEERVALEAHREHIHGTVRALCTAGTLQTELQGLVTQLAHFLADEQHTKQAALHALAAIAAVLPESVSATRRPLALPVDPPAPLAGWLWRVGKFVHAWYHRMRHCVLAGAGRAVHQFKAVQLELLHRGAQHWSDRAAKAKGGWVWQGGMGKLAAVLTARWMCVVIGRAVLR